MRLFGWITTLCAVLVGMTSAAWAMPPGPDTASLLSPRTSPALAQPATGLPRVKPRATAAQLPLFFVANQGQTDPEVKFLAHGRAYTLFLTSSEVVLVLKRQSPANGQQSAGGKGKGAGAVVRLQLVDANSAPRVSGLEELPGKSNYFIGNHPKHWHTNIPTYARVKYEAVYPGVDVVYYGHQQQLEYDFVVAPGANPQAVKLAFEGADKVETDAQGDLVVHTAGGELRLRKPRIYQEINGVPQPIPGHYTLLEPGGLNKPAVGFEVAAYDASRPLVIDPVLEYSTYLGGSSSENAPGSENPADSELFDGGNIAVDSSGNAYVTGWTNSADFPTESPLQATNGGGVDVFVTKLDPTGSALVYSTYLGGSGDDYGHGIAVDSSGNAYVTGWTDSTDFPTMNPFQATIGRYRDAFVTKLNPTGSALVYSTYLGGSGGSGEEYGLDVAVDSSGNAHGGDLVERRSRHYGERRLPHEKSFPVDSQRRR